MSHNTSFVGTALTLWRGEDGAILSAELVLVLTIAVLPMIVGLKEVSQSVNNELEDVAEAIGALNQSFTFTGMEGCTSCVSGSSFNDEPDVCDCEELNNFVGHIHVSGKCE